MITEGNEKRRVIRLEKPDTKRPESSRNIQDQIEKRWIILRKPGQIPRVKTPPNNDEGLCNMLNEIIKLYPYAQLTVVRLVYGQQIWVNDGKEYIQIQKSHNKSFNLTKAKGQVK